MNDIIARKKAGKKLTEAEINRVVRGATTGDIPDYQLSALLMAICFQGMDVEERAYLTRAMAASGRKLDFASVAGTKVDKHSTGGVGDKISLMLAPWLAAAGRKVPMISGRGLGFTGGTLDKLASIPGYHFDHTPAELTGLLNTTGCFVIGQSADIAPADKKIYALRDVTATVDEISLITASILSKKLTEDLDALVMDVKCGSGAFMQSLRDAKALAKSIADTAISAGVETTCLITAMDFPLGRYTGNTAETFEAIEFCKPSGIYIETARKIFITKTKLSREENLVAALVEITMELAIAMLDPKSRTDKRIRAKNLGELMALWENGKLEERLKSWVLAQKGNLVGFKEKAGEITSALAGSDETVVYNFRAATSGYLAHCDSRAIGNLMVDLGAGRKKSTDNIAEQVTLEMLKGRGEQCAKGEAMFRIYKPDLNKADREKIAEIGATAFRLTKAKVRPAKNIMARL